MFVQMPQMPSIEKLLNLLPRRCLSVATSQIALFLQNRICCLNRFGVEESVLDLETECTDC